MVSTANSYFGAALVILLPRDLFCNVSSDFLECSKEFIQVRHCESRGNLIRLWQTKRHTIAATVMLWVRPVDTGMTMSKSAVWA
jgi:hypothetical protein